jgi:hypothetical protein
VEKSKILIGTVFYGLILISQFFIKKYCSLIFLFIIFVQFMVIIVIITIHFLANVFEYWFLHEKLYTII